MHPDDQRLKGEVTKALEGVIRSVLKASPLRPLDSHEDYEDLLQEMRLLAWKRWSEAKPTETSSLFHYLFVCLKGLLLAKAERLHRKRINTTPLDDEIVVFDTPASDIHSDAVASEFEDSLGGEDRCLLEMRKEGHSMREVGKSVRMSKSWVFNRMGNLRDQYNQFYEESNKDEGQGPQKETIH